ncbi:UNVERIFIED_CONTAM: putative E3 ubiquitin-protein ligase EDA40 [Sesamum calycinum]|uniref:E3 ubiquitin-protein ligase EDA40 n=1 Tax=Sesamum calycinum TaxID=2727403 RepID=A0AAW2MCP0_9LAMI
MGGGGGGAAWKVKKAAKKIFVPTCACAAFCRKQQTHILHNSTVSCDSASNSSQLQTQKSNISCKNISSGTETTSPSSSNKNLCAICLDPLDYSSGGSTGQALFTAQCSHAFHFACILSNVRHGSLTCPICRAHWTQLPRSLSTWSSLRSKTDPVLQILDDSIANLRVHRRSFFSSARYDDDDPVEPGQACEDQPRLHLSLQSVPFGSSSMEESPQYVPTPLLCSLYNRAYLLVKLADQPATDVVLVASPNGPHLRLMKHAMALVVFSLRSMDRLAIVTYSSAAARVFPLRRMTSYGKRSALQVIDHLFYTGQADAMQGLKKGVKILSDRVHKNPDSRILHLTDAPSPSYHWFNPEVPVTIHRFHVGSGFGTSNRFIMHEFEEFLTRTLGGGIEDVQLRVREDKMVVRIGELRGGEERNIPLYTGESGRVCVDYRYRDGRDGECIRTGKIVLGLRTKGDRRENREGTTIGGRVSCAENWDYHDPFMARRWAKHLRGGYRLYSLTDS